MFSKSAVILVLAAVAVAGCREQGTSAKGHDQSEPAKAAPTPAAEQDHHDHAPVDPDKAAAMLRLDDGKKWQTDDTLRASMTNIRDAMQAAVKPIHSEAGFSADDYKALAGKIDAEIGVITTKCKLPREVDDQFHLILGQLLAGTDLMKKDGDRIQGAVKVIQGLQAYPKFFEHADWKPIEH